ncbi:MULTISPECIES: HAD-IIA family hydrolase [Rhodobacterales]|jgi:HAD superfamily hydrolase (TIGR01450 family)|uniref:HAD-IIA family hydrolase n=1 Tax=Rhodobacterales TaxID=204455 RepID=UPI00237F333F|nr:HAD-IIA family hydrolase [Phaeobacter gallaeciensis]MDE4141795.1 HAD-IIA family hydrolase [Phaeobacter gallaeciensis]MDE4150257.1 HAD-IIA family hydrolase [Phaeobacter gallaeciensis]MDE4154466.1 HAD-IIA family hydrolase [Phaeobacter gallaeciensis]MDE4229874.1 HAD-IIA family hydrolase [Phaeobacter gallaeciensis]MDE4258932.1 HAD-IIA family hydrolase [Phaeobacter gallaeciensis]
MTPEAAFARYEEIRAHLPVSNHKGKALPVSGIDQVMDQTDAFVFDAYGVLNVGDSPIPGAHERVQQLRDAGKALLVLTNAASFTRAQTEEKFARLGFDFAAEEIISSREVCETCLTDIAPDGTWGVMAPAGFEASELPVAAVALGNTSDTYDAADAFLLLSTSDWTEAQQGMLHDSLARNPRPLVVANPDLVAPRETGLTLEPGFYAVALRDQLGISPVFHGKPFPSVYAAAQARLGDIAPQRITMVGDTLHTDVLGAQAQGWNTALITAHGLFAGHDVTGYIERSGIVPDWIAPSI